MPQLDAALYLLRATYYLLLITTYLLTAFHLLQASVPQLDAALRHVVHALLAGTDEAAARLSPGMQPAVLTPTLGYLRDRISVPRDMCYPAARQLRAHLNWLIETTARAEA